MGLPPNKNTIPSGWPRHARWVHCTRGRPKTQKEPITQLAALIRDSTRPDGLAVVMEASHFCMSWRGVREMDSKMLNSVMRGAFLTNPELRREFLSLVSSRR